MTYQPREDVVFSLEPKVEAVSAAPEQLRAEEEGYRADAGYGVFPWEIAEEGGPDGAVYLMGALWSGVTHVAYQEDDDKHGYFIAKREGEDWRWVLWRCAWDDNMSNWYWADDAATDWATDDPVAAGEQMIRRVWTNWVEHGNTDPPLECDPGLIDHATMSEMIRVTTLKRTRKMK